MKIETLANEIASLSNKNLNELAKTLINDYFTHGDALQTFINIEIHEQIQQQKLSQQEVEDMLDDFNYVGSRHHY
jgi:hypothetical protein